MGSDAAVKPMLMRELVGEALRQERVAQGRTLREVSKAARVSLGYLSEVERGQKEASSELLASICGALEMPLSVVLTMVAEKLAMAERVASLPTIRPIARAAA
jgi:transcriptional regulator with XRE-family HTH domain